MKKGWILSILLVLIIISLAAAIYFLYVNINTCQNQECFNQAMVKCKRVYFTSDTADTAIGYKILGKNSDKCDIEVTLLQVKRGLIELAALEGSKMICSIDYGVLTTPETNLKNCHGILKENIQEIIIKRMHSQIVQNLGQISEETTKVL